MFQVIAPIKVTGKSVNVKLASRDKTKHVIHNYGYSLKNAADAEIALVKPGNKPYIGVHEKLDDFSVGIVTGVIQDVVPGESSTRLRVKAEYGPYITVFDRPNDKFEVGASFAFVGPIQIGTYKGNEQYTMFARASECLDKEPKDWFSNADI